MALPTTNDPGTCAKHLFQWNGSKWSVITSTMTTTRGTVGQVYTSTGPNTEPGWAAPVGGGTGDRLLPVTAVSFPTTNAARVDGSEINARLLFDNATTQCAYWGPFRMNPDYASNPVFKMQYAMSSAITGCIAIDVEVMAVTPGDATDLTGTGAVDSYDSVNTCTDAAVPPTTAGKMEEISCPLTFNDSMAARDLLKIRLCRNVAR